MRIRRLLWVGTCAAVFALGAADRPSADERTEPDQVVVQHILIGFKSSIRNKKLERTKKQAKELAERLFDQAGKGEDFDALVREHTNDTYPGIMKITNEHAPRRPDARKRSDLVPSFGDTAFGLEVGQVGLVAYHAYGSPYGWHVIRRLE